MQASEDGPIPQNVIEKNLKNASNKDVEVIGKQIADLTLTSPNDPPEVQRRLKAMKKLQVELLEAECQFFKDLHELESKYSSTYQKLCEKRSSIISGKHEPTEEECAFTLPNDEENGEAQEGGEGKVKKNETEVNANEVADPVTGVPRFWLTVFQSVPQLADMIEEHDIPILEHLEDVKVELTKEPLGFQLDFKFSPNPFFTNPILTKAYEMRCVVDPKDPFSFEGPEIIKSTGCTIDWKTGKNVTVREVKKKQKHKQSGAIRTVTKQEPCSSFFNFFNPPQVDDTDEEDEAEMERMTTDFQVGQYLRERVIPRAVLYYTGEISMSDDEDEDEYSTEGETEEESEGASGSGTGAEEEEVTPHDDEDQNE